MSGNYSGCSAAHARVEVVQSGEELLDGATVAEGQVAVVLGDPVPEAAIVLHGVPEEIAALHRRLTVALELEGILPSWSGGSRVTVNSVDADVSVLTPGEQIGSDRLPAGGYAVVVSAPPHGVDLVIVGGTTQIRQLAKDLQSDVELFVPLSGVEPDWSQQ